MCTLAELEAPRTASRRHALLRDLERTATQAAEQRQQLAEKLGRADRFIATLQDRGAAGTTAA